MPDQNMVVVGGGLQGNQTKEKRQWTVRASEFAKSTFNPIRSIVDSMKIEPHPDKYMIALSIGDPTIFGNLKPHDTIIEAIQGAVAEMKFNGYAPTVGYHDARVAVAEYYSNSEAPVMSNDVILCSGCSHALDLCISALASRGQNILMPRPGFSIYRTLGAGYGINTKFYNLQPEAGWEVDLDHLESLIDKNTAAIIVNNPSNPCGSVYSKEHLLDIIKIAERHCLPIIADEIYDFFVFKGETFYPLATLSKNIPILSCSGLTKRFLVPGWRMGWILIHDRNNLFAPEIRGALQSLSQRIIGSNTIAHGLWTTYVGESEMEDKNLHGRWSAHHIRFTDEYLSKTYPLVTVPALIQRILDGIDPEPVQGALPAILRNTPTSFFDETIAVVQVNAEIAFEKIQLCPGLHPIKPQGAMYMMVGIEMERYPEFATEFQFVERLVSEQSVFCLPGKCFEYPDYFRIVLTVPKEQLLVAMDRIMEFCDDHHIEEKNAGQQIVEVNGEKVHIDHTISSYCSSGHMAKT